MESWKDEGDFKEGIACELEVNGNNYFFLFIFIFCAKNLIWYLVCFLMMFSIDIKTLLYMFYMYFIILRIIQWRSYYERSQ